MSDQLKRDAARAAIDWLLPQLTPKTVIGIGTGATVDYFIELLAEHKELFSACVSSSKRSSARLQACEIRKVDISEVTTLDVYIDGIDEGTPQGVLIKGGGAALSREKILATLAEQFVCIADPSKRVSQLGAFPLPMEVLAVAIPHVSKTLEAMGGMPVVREGVVTDNGHRIIDCSGLSFADPKQLEARLNSIPGVLDNGIFALRRADLMLIATPGGIEQVTII